MSPDHHMPSCEAEVGHRHSCAAATELARLRAFAEAVRDELACTAKLPGDGEDYPDACDHVDDCWHCGAVQALERVT